MFTKRTTKPSANNKFYITKSNGGYSICVKGKVKSTGKSDPECDVLANCVGYACGRFNEIIGAMKYPELNCNAENFIERAKSLGLKISDKPTLGGILVWQKGSTLKESDGAGHVAVVEEIYNDKSILTSESAYNGNAFYTTKRNNDDQRWGASSSYIYRGCIINPSVKEETKEYKYKIGDVVNINCVYTSSSSDKKITPAITKGKITKIVNARNPYLLDDGNIGWINDDCVVVATEQQVNTKPIEEHKEEKINPKNENINEEFVKNSQKTDLYYEKPDDLDYEEVKTINNPLLHIIDSIINLIKKIFKL